MTLTLSDYRPGLLLAGVAPLSAHEPAWSLYERDVFTFDGKTEVREQTIRVVRNERLVEFTARLGPSDQFAVAPFAVASMLEDSVQAVREIADFMREESEDGLQNAMREHLEDFNVIEAAILQAQQMQTYQRQNTRTTRTLRQWTNKETKRPLVHAISAATYT